MYTYVALHVCQGWPVNSGPPAFGRAGIHGGIVGDQILWEVESALTRKFRQEIGSSQNGSQLTWFDWFCLNLFDMFDHAFSFGLQFLHLFYSEGRSPLGVLLCGWYVTRQPDHLRPSQTSAWPQPLGLASIKLGTGHKFEPKLSKHARSLRASACRHRPSCPSHQTSSAQFGFATLSRTCSCCIVSGMLSGFKIRADCRLWFCPCVFAHAVECICICSWKGRSVRAWLRLVKPSWDYQLFESFAVDTMRWSNWGKDINEEYAGLLRWQINEHVCMQRNRYLRDIMRSYARICVYISSPYMSGLLVKSLCLKASLPELHWQHEVERCAEFGLALFPVAAPDANGRCPSQRSGKGWNLGKQTWKSNRTKSHRFSARQQSGNQDSRSFAKVCLQE